MFTNNKKRLLNLQTIRSHPIHKKLQHVGSVMDYENGS